MVERTVQGFELVTAACVLLAAACGGALDRPGSMSDASVSYAPDVDARPGSMDAATPFTMGTSDSGASPAPANDAGDASVDARAPASPCPPAVPDAGSPCAPSGGGNVLSCEYGGTVHGVCTTLAQCRLGHWSVSPPPDACGQNASACPTAYGTGVGAACPDANAICDYAEGRCACAGCDVAADGGLRGGTWLCRPWPAADAGCPGSRPLAGTACTAPDGTLCGSGCCDTPSTGWPMQCSAGVWTLVTCTADCRGPTACRSPFH
jgi:hypothetical protein